MEGAREDDESAEEEVLSAWRESRQARWHRRNPWNQYLVGARKRCRRDPHYVKLGIECHLTTAEIKFLWHRDRAAELREPSLDRIDPAGDYVFMNCRFIEFEENRRIAREGRNGSARRSEESRVEDEISFA